MNNDVSDNELISLLGEENDQVKDLIYEKYGYLINVIIHKYSQVIKMFQVDEQELKSEALLGFSDGIYSFCDDKNASLKTFLTICIERRVTKCLSKYTTNKYFALSEALSLDYISENNISLMDSIKDDQNLDPLNNLTAFETFDEIVSVAKKVLSDFEYTVFTYMLNELSYIEISEKLGKSPKQIDNTMQRIKLKMRKALENLKIN